MSSPALTPEQPPSSSTGPTNQPMLNQIDLAVIGVYFLFVIGASLLSMYRRNRSTLSGFFLAGRQMSWLPVGASLFASNIGSEHFIGLAGSGAASGIGVGAFEFNAIILLQLLGWVFLPVFLASRVGTLPEYMNKRFGGKRIRIYLAFLSLILYIFTKISVNLYSGAIFIQQALRWSLWWSVMVVLSVTIVTTVLGGLAAVIYTDTLQFFIMIAGSLMVMFKALSSVGGYSSLQHKYLTAIPSKTIPNTTCGLPSQDSWVMLRGVNDPDMPWLGFVLGQTPASIWYWCADQMMVQRALSAKSLSHAQGATLFAGFVKVLPMFVMVLPGMISRVLFTDEVACVVAEECERICGNPLGCSNIAYPKLVLNIMPQGLRGIMVSVMLAALMSDLTSIFNSASTLFTIDLYGSFWPKTSERRKIMAGRLFVAVLVGVSMAWIPLIERTQGGQLYIYIQSVAAYIAPPIAAVYSLAVLWPRLNEQGAFWGLMAGFLCGMVRMLLDFIFSSSAPQCWQLEDPRPSIITSIHYMYFAMMLFWLSLVVSALVTVLTPAQDESWRVVRTTYLTRHDRSPRPDEQHVADTCPPRAHVYEMKETTQTSSSCDAEYNTVKNVYSEGPAVVIGAWSRVYNWLCGFQNTSQQEIEIRHVESQQLQKLASIEQQPWERRLLATLLVVVIGGGCTLLIFFSVNPFSGDHVLQLQSTRLAELGYPPPSH